MDGAVVDVGGTDTVALGLHPTRKLISSSMEIFLNVRIFYLPSIGVRAIHISNYTLIKQSACEHLTHRLV